MISIDSMVDGMTAMEWRANMRWHRIKIDNAVYKDVIIYDDHRSILDVLCYARIKGVLEQAPNLVYFDRHDDATKVHKDNLEILDKIPSDQYREFHNFVEFDLSYNDDNWLYAGMYRNLIKNAVLVNGVEKDNIPELNKAFKNLGHHLYEINNHYLQRLSVGKRVWKIKKSDDNAIRSIFDKNLRQEDNAEIGVPMVLDFDLDCFTREDANGHLKACSRSNFRKNYKDAYCMGAFMRELMRRASFITICREPKHCGGYSESNKILQYLDEFFFDGQLKA